LFYGDLEYIYIPQGNVWKPDISLQNGFENLEELGSKFIQVYVTSNGYILWKPFQIFDSKCNLNPTYFPLDEQTCHLDFVVWSLDIDDVTLSVEKDRESKPHGNCISHTLSHFSGNLKSKNVKNGEKNNWYDDVNNDK
jgi:hypothetical protein